MDVEASRGSRSTSKLIHAYVFGVVFAAAGLGFLVVLIRAVLTQSLAAGWRALLASPYGLSVLTDYVVGSIFGAMFIYLREGPYFLGLNHKVIALLSPFVGSFLPLFYISFMIFTLKDLQRVFVPKSAQEDMAPIYDPAANTSETKAVGLSFTGLLIFFVGVFLWAVTTQSLGDGLSDLKREVWIDVAFKDTLAGLLLTAVYVIVREGGVLSVVVPWVLALALFGNGPTCAYVMMLAHESLRRNISFKTLLLSRSKPNI